MNGSFIAIENNMVLTSIDKKTWKKVDGHFVKISDNNWTITYLTTNNNFVVITYNCGKYTLCMNSNKLFSIDGIGKPTVSPITPSLIINLIFYNKLIK